MTTSEIYELGLLADIELISDRYEARYGAPPINLSTWNPSPKFASRLGLRLPAAHDLRGIDYVFSYEVPETIPIIRRLGFDPNKHGCLLTHSGSSAIVASVNWLRRTGCTKVLIIGPRYFTVPYAISSLGMDWTVVHMHRRDSGVFSFPNLSEEILEKIDAAWLTNPIYCTGIDYDLHEVNQVISRLSERGIRIVIDECLSVSNRRIAPLAADGRLAAIYAPHKSVCINGIKFAATIFSSSEQAHFDAWCDVWNGCLPISSLIAVRHFLSDDFDRYASEFNSLTSDSHDRIRSIVKRAPSLALDEKAKGYLISVYAPKIDARKGLDPAFLEKAANSTGAIFIAGARNEMEPAAGLSFRINLASIDSAALGAFSRLCDWLS